MVPVETGRNKVVGMVPLDNRVRITVDGSLEYPSPARGEGIPNAITRKAKLVVCRDGQLVQNEA